MDIESQKTFEANLARSLGIDLDRYNTALTLAISIVSARYSFLQANDRAALAVSMVPGLLLAKPRK